jgi:histidine triad (HIT) family protein
MKKSRPAEKPQETTDGQEELCLFCKIVSREMEAKIIFEDEISMAFLDVRPLFPGHVLLVPKAHYHTLSDLPAALVGPFFLNAQMLAGKVQQVMKAEGSFVAMNNVVSQSVAHLHVHIVPRRKGDGLRGFFWPRLRYKDEEMLATHEALASPSKSGASKSGPRQSDPSETAH